MRKQRSIIKPLLLFAGAVLLLLVWSAWQIFGPTVNSPEGKYFYIRTGASFEDVKNQLREQHIVNTGFIFQQLSARIGYTNKVRPGKYEIRDRSSLISLLRMLKSGRQTPVRLVINKIRTKEDFAGKLGRQFEADSLEIIRFLNSPDSLAGYQLDSNTVMSAFIPNSYLVWWNGPFGKLFGRLQKQQALFWEGRRSMQAEKLGLTPLQVMVIASIVEEETNKDDEKGNVASVYYNRYKKGMRLEADPTVKFALKDFALKRILQGHLQFESPYNTYRNAGLPPGPICTPSIKTIDAVLNMPETNYLFFAAKPEFNGYHNFASTYSEHLVNAQAYRKALDELIRKKAEAQP